MGLVQFSRSGSVHQHFYDVSVVSNVRIDGKVIGDKVSDHGWCALIEMCLIACHVNVFLLWCNVFKSQCGDFILT